MSETPQVKPSDSAKRGNSDTKLIERLIAEANSPDSKADARWGIVTGVGFLVGLAGLVIMAVSDRDGLDLGIGLVMVSLVIGALSRLAARRAQR